MRVLAILPKLALCRLYPVSAHLSLILVRRVNLLGLLLLLLLGNARFEFFGADAHGSFTFLIGIQVGTFRHRREAGKESANFG